MNIFVDTSAFWSLLDGADQNHRKAKETLERLISQEVVLICNNYIITETFALIQKRFGMEAVRAFHEDIMNLLNIEWVDEQLHQSSLMSLIAVNRRELSFVDCVCFEMMRKLELKKVFTFDRHFKEQGFECIP